MKYGESLTNTLDYIYTNGEEGNNDRLEKLNNITSSNDNSILYNIDSENNTFEDNLNYFNNYDDIYTKRFDKTVKVGKNEHVVDLADHSLDTLLNQ